MNLCILKGNICKDVDLKFAKGTGTAVAKFSIAVARMKKDDPADFFNVTAFGKTAETIAERLQKGSPILIEGHLQSGSYKDKDGKTIYTTDVIVNRFEFVGGKREETAVTSDNDMTPIEDDGDIPF